MPKASDQTAETTARGIAPGTRERLIEAAATAIAGSGWGAVTTRQVAAIAGVNAALVHYHFGSMDVLRRETAVNVLLAETTQPTHSLIEAPTLAKGVEECLAAIQAFDPRSPHAVVLYESILAASRDSELRAMLDEALGKFRSLLRDRIAHEGGADPGGVAGLLAAALDGLFLHRLIDPSLDLNAMGSALVFALQLPPKETP